MKINRWKASCVAVLLSICMIKICDVAYAAEDNYTTLTVDATDDESGVYMYAIDSTEDSAWQESNIFYVLPNTLHTVYVKDAAGNITSSEVLAEEEAVVDYDAMYDMSGTEYETETDIIEEYDPYAAGVGTGSATVSDYTDDSSKEFYTITTKNGNNFYLIIDHRNSDSNVYFTKPVSELDILTLAAEAGEVEESDLEQAKTEADPIEEIDEEKASDNSKSSSVMEYLPMIVFVALLCAGYYYFMIYKKKKAIAEEYDEDAADMDQFIPVEDDEDIALFSYKGNKTSAEGDEDMDSILDEFYENNSEMDDFETEPEEDYNTGIPDDYFNGDEPATEAEDQYEIFEDYDPGEIEVEDQEEDDM